MTRDDSLVTHDDSMVTHRDSCCVSRLAFKSTSTFCHNPTHTAQKMPRACQADLIDIRIDGSDVSVSILGDCPKCGTGSGHIEIKSGSVRAYQTDKAKNAGISCIQIEATTANIVCELETQAQIIYPRLNSSTT